jgi:micrococcal nuclease
VIRGRSAALLAAMFLVASCGPGPLPSGVSAEGLAGPTGPTEVAVVASVTDGDTIRVELDGENVPVRYIGIDAPETRDPVEPFGAEATDANEQLVAGREVVLERDVSDVDRFGRLLRYVWIEMEAGWILVNLELVRQGMATVVTFPPDVKYHDEVLLPAQREAREAGVGLWSDD